MPRSSVTNYEGITAARKELVNVLMGEAVYGVKGDITVREERGERCGN